MILKWEMASCIIFLWNTRVKLIYSRLQKIVIFCEIRSEVFNESKEVHV